MRDLHVSALLPIERRFPNRPADVYCWPPCPSPKRGLRRAGIEVLDVGDDPLRGNAEPSNAQRAATMELTDDDLRNRSKFDLALGEDGGDW